MNVNFIHNATFAKALPPTYLAQARGLADYHENGVFSSPDPLGPGNSESPTPHPARFADGSYLGVQSPARRLSRRSLAVSPVS